MNRVSDHCSIIEKRVRLHYHFILHEQFLNMHRHTQDICEIVTKLNEYQSAKASDPATFPTSGSEIDIKES